MKSMTREFKKSDIEWYDSVPVSWKKVKVGWLFNLIASGTTPPSNNTIYYDGGIPWLNTGDLKDRVIESTTKTITEKAIKEFSTLKLYPKNSLVMAMYGATIGKLGITKFETTTNQACCVMAQPKDTVSKYIFYWLMGNRKEIINLSQGGGQPNINQNIIKNLKLYLPSYDEQQAIANFLDDKTSEIDSLIADKEKLIELLEEKRQAIITEAVTKGLNPNVKMKDSGVEWIGEIPEHWNYVKLKRCFKVYNGKEINIELNSDDESGVDVYGSGGIFKRTDQYLYNKESVLFGRKGTIGKPIYVDNKFWTVDTMYYTKFYKGMFPKWFYYVLSVFPWEIHTTQTALPSVVGSDIENEFWGVPSYAEQKLIAEHLDRIISEIHETINEIKAQLVTLKDYRQSLIYEAVTGKIDVRDYKKVLS